MLYRRLGRTGAQVSALGGGGHHLGDIPGVDEAIRLVHEAIDAGVTFFDNCWEYYNGKMENILGRALKGRRDRVFLMTMDRGAARQDGRLARRLAAHGHYRAAARQRMEARQYRYAARRQRYIAQH